MIVTFLAFVNALDGEFVYDDRIQILTNPTLRMLSNVPKMFTQSVWQFQDLTYDRPIRWLLVSGVTPLSAQVQEEWVARYTGPESGIHYASAIAVDAQGNVYVTGQSAGVGTGYDYATIKYDPEGNQVWVARYDGPRHDADYATAIAVDAEGNVYVTGSSSGLGPVPGPGSWDYATIKYDWEGNQVWVARYDGPGHLSDRAKALAVDAQGNVYVTGDSVGVGTGPDYATIKYDSEGNEVWVARYDDRNLSDCATALAVDVEGNVYVTGWSCTQRSFRGCGAYHYVTIKYDQDGRQAWVAHYRGPSGFDAAWAITVDTEGNTYVTGQSAHGSWDYATIKYDWYGNQLWVARYNGPGNAEDEAKAIAVDGEGNVYVTGRSRGVGTEYDYATIKYDREGNEVWVARYDGPGHLDDRATAIAVDAEGNVYVTGQSWGVGANYDYATVRYDPDGNQNWVAIYNGPGNGDDYANAIALDGKGNVYVTGVSCLNTAMLCRNSDYATIKYSQFRGLMKE